MNLKQIFKFSSKPKSFDGRLLYLTQNTSFTHEQISELMQVAGMNIDEIEIIVNKQESFEVPNLNSVIEDVKKGLYNWKELLNN